MKRPKPRANNKWEIIDRIDRLNNLMWDRKRRAEKLDHKADELFKKGERLPEAREFRDEAKRLRKMEPATMRRIEHLKQKLSEIQTAIILGILPDESVQL